jgi:hypothetical protein
MRPIAHWRRKEGSQHWRVCYATAVINVEEDHGQGHGKACLRSLIRGKHCICMRDFSSGSVHPSRFQPLFCMRSAPTVPFAMPATPLPVHVTCHCHIPVCHPVNGVPHGVGTLPVGPAAAGCLLTRGELIAALAAYEGERRLVFFRHAADGSIVCAACGLHLGTHADSSTRGEALLKEAYPCLHLGALAVGSVCGLWLLGSFVSYTRR